MKSIVSNSIPDNIICLVWLKLIQLRRWWEKGESLLSSSKPYWIQRPVKSIEIFPLPTVSFWSCHNFILQRIVSTHLLRFFPSFRHHNFASLYAFFYISFRKSWPTFPSLVQKILWKIQLIKLHKTK